MMKKPLLTFVLAAAATGIGAVALAANPTGGNWEGSDTLEPVSRDVLLACAEDPVIHYIGGGSGKGQAAMVQGKQQLAPMSRAMNSSDGICNVTNLSKAAGYRIALDGIAIVNKSTSCVGDGVAGGNATQVCFDVTERNNVAGLQCPDCTGTQYCFANEKDALRVLYAGFTKNGGNAMANRDCNSDVRHSLAAQWHKLFQDGCTADGGCTQINHAWRRDDASGTTDTFLTLLGLPSIVRLVPATGTTPAVNPVDPFCNGNTVQDLDPIRRPCAPDDQVCGIDQLNGLVLPVTVPALVEGDEGQQFPTQACQVGNFSLAAPAQQTVLSTGSIRFDCPERANFSVAGNCLAPRSATNQFNCISPKLNPNVFFVNLNDDARRFNRFLRKPTGALMSAQAAFRIDSACTDDSSTENIGCLAAEYDCSVGFAGREATFVPGAKALLVKGIAPTVPAIRLLKQPTGLNTPGVYPFTRFLYLNSVVGFAAVTGNEDTALDCFLNQTTLDTAVSANGFVTLDEAPICEDFPELTRCPSYAGPTGDGCAP
jgi:hypothetical protein